MNLAQFGPFFALEPWRPNEVWRPLDEFVSDPAVLADRIATAGTVLAGRAGLAADALDQRVIASTVSLGLFARLLSPAFAATVATGAVPPLKVANLWWRPVIVGPLPMATSATDPPVPATDPAAMFADRIVAGIVAPVLAMFAHRYRLSLKVLWGNAASALAGAATMLAAADPAVTERAGSLAEAVLDLPPLLGTGCFERPDPAQPRGFFVRRSCCLFYRIPAGGTCGDCVLTPTGVRRAQWRAALTS
ncbi:(2Fe-2S)-binding protein [Micromonospora aurantiaca (nom. illeg.)]|uniref:(2Fe-2S)-binding protein n=1 Tax=Micromonospora aurantiaca (nom. illeg.) TaxID=47850 RepID=UPI0016575F28|nr:(2Fe-2S)-binding protein [Micromonospora aurantiaca]MBC9003660.1 (2Fe-2S)-binding protein [Micromonospora aurantiaca]